MYFFRLLLPNLDKLTGAMPNAVGNAEITNLREVEGYLKVNDRTIYRLLSAKKLPAFKVGGSWRFKKAVIDQWFSHQFENVEAAEGTADIRECK